LLNSLATAREILARLVAFDTTSAKSNLPLIDYVRAHLAELGITSTLIPSPDGQKASLFATIGPDGEGGIGLSGHSDCVPVAGERWTSDPFVLTERDGKLFARGACDMKGFLACVLAAAPLFTARALKEPVHIIVSYDEEVGCTGVRPMIERLGQDLPLPRLVIVGEPTMMVPTDAHKGIDSYRTVVTGKEAHSSKPRLGVNAISVAARLIRELDLIGTAFAEAGHDERFEPSSSTLQVGTIAGGTAPNIVPKTCSFKWQCRTLPSVDPAEPPRRLAAFAATLLPAMRAVAPDASIETSHEGGVPAFRALPESEAVSLSLSLTGANITDAVSFATEAGLFQQAGCSTVICGPGDISHAHAADEFVSIAQIGACLIFLDRLAGRLSR
jgi:acetylornithine deacetylase